MIKELFLALFMEGLPETTVSPEQVRRYEQQRQALKDLDINKAIEMVMRAEQFLDVALEVGSRLPPQEILGLSGESGIASSPKAAALKTVIEEAISKLVSSSVPSGVTAAFKEALAETIVKISRGRMTLSLYAHSHLVVPASRPLLFIYDVIGHRPIFTRLLTSDVLQKSLRRMNVIY